MALLATAYERPVETSVVAKIERACERWNEGEKALAHIHLAHAALPACDEDRALRLFVAEELLDNAVPQNMLLKAPGFDAQALDLVKYPGQPRIPKGNGRESGQYTYGRSNVTPAAYRVRKAKTRTW